jgi:uncharacterized protein YbbC (DUF1343 family)
MRVNGGPLENRKRVRLGVERLLTDKRELLADSRVGLVCNQASVDHGYRHVADLFFDNQTIKTTAFFGPQHGIRGDVQDNMIETDHSVDRRTGLPIYSLYSETREPTQEMLKDIDTIVFDMQDVGCRIYTFVYTLANCMRVAARLGKLFVVCDRPNPINGVTIEGNLLEHGWESFVGQFPLPTRHGLTVGELALMFKKAFGIDCDLTVVPMEGWSRELWHDETDAPWVLPSPNMPTLDTATVFSGAVHFEGTQLSEGRGTTRPFELIGAPYIEPFEFSEALNDLELPGTYFRAAGFLPTFQKHREVFCGGVQIHVTDRERFNSVKAGIAVLKAAFDIYPGKFLWKEPPYEYVYDRNPFDVICGTDRIRKQLEQGESLDSIFGSWEKGLIEFEDFRREFLIY